MDHESAYHWFREAAYQGHIQSQKNVGAAHWNGDGAPHDEGEAAFWYELAAMGKDPQAQFAIGWFLMNGRGVKEDRQMGLRWIRRAAAQGYQPAIDFLRGEG